MKENPSSCLYHYVRLTLTCLSFSQNKSTARPNPVTSKPSNRDINQSKSSRTRGQIWQWLHMFSKWRIDAQVKLGIRLICLWCRNKLFLNTVLNCHGNNLRKLLRDPWIKLYWRFEGANNTLELIRCPIYWPRNSDKYILQAPQWMTEFTELQTIICIEPLQPRW